MSDLKIQGVVEMSSEGAERALDRVADKAGQMSSRLEKEAGKAGKAVDSIADGAGKSADEFSRAEGKIVASIKRATTQLEQLGKTASQKLDLRISERGLDPARFEPMLGKLRELELAQARATAGSAAMAAGYGGQFSNNVRNASFQIQDFAVQVNGGVDATKALAMQLPQMLVGFGTAGAVIGVVAALLPNLVQAFGSTAGASKTLGDAMSDFNKAVGAVGETVKQFDMDKVYEEFNKANGATQKAIAEQLRFQQAFIETSRLVAGKKFGESLSGVGEFGTLDKLAGAFGSTGAERLAKQLGIGLETAKDLLPTLNGLKTGTEDVNNAFQRFGTALLGGNAEAVKLATGMADLAKSERDAASASTAISEAQGKMATGHAQTKKEAEDAAKATKALVKEQAALADLLNTINAKDTGFDANYVKNVELLLGAYGKGKLSLEGFNEAFGRYVAMQPGAVAAERERAKASEDYVKAIAAAIDPLEKQANNLEREVMYYGMTETAIQNTLVARLEEARAIAAANGAWPEHLAFLDREIEARQRIATASSQKEFLDTNKRAVEASAREWEKFADDINRSLTDALFRAFESGSGFGKSFADTLGNTLKAAVAKALINVAITTGSNALNTGINALLGTSAANNGAGTNYLGLASNASSVYNLVNGTYATAGLAAYSQYQAGIPIAQWSLTNAAPVTTAVNTSGVAANGMAPSSGMGAASTVAWVAAIVAGMWMSSQAWKQGIRWDNYAKQPGVQYWDAEVGIRALHDKPAEMLFGKDFVNSELYAILGGGSLSAQIHYGIQGALFGKERVTGSQLSGTFSESDQGFTGRSGVNMKKSGGLFSGSKEWTEWSDLPTEIDGIFDALYRVTRNSFVMLGDVFGDSGLAGKINGFVFQYKDDGFETIEEQIQKMSEQLAASLGQTLLPSIEGMAVTTEQNGKKITETWSQTFQRVVTEANAVNTVFDLLGNSLSTIYGNNTDKILAASDAFVKLFGSIDAMSASINAYYDNFYTAEEKRRRQLVQIQQRLSAGGLNFSVAEIEAASRDTFRSVADALMKQGDAGAVAFKALMDVQGAFAELHPALESTTTAAKAAADEAAALAVANQAAAEAAAANAASIADSLSAGFSADIAGASSLADRQLAYLTSVAQIERQQREAALRDVAAIERTRLSGVRAAANEQISLVKSLLSTLQGGIKDLRGEVASTVAMQASAAQRFIAEAALSAQAGGYLPDASALSEAIAAARGGLKDENFATSFERDFAKLVLAGNLESIAGAAGKQLPVAEQALKVAKDQLGSLEDGLEASLRALGYYDQMVDGIKSQIDALKGIDNGIGGLSGSLADMGAQIVAGLSSSLAAINGAVVAQASAGTIGTKTAADLLKQGGLPTDELVISGGKQVAISSQGAVAERSPTGDVSITANTGWKGSVAEAKQIVAEAFTAMPPADFYAAAKKVGLSSTFIDAMYELPAGTALAWAEANKLPAFEVGTNRVPQDMLAVVHKNEAIIPAAFNPWAGGGNMQSAGDDRLVRLVESLTAEVQRLQGLIATGNRHAERTATVLDDASRGRQPLITETAA